MLRGYLWQVTVRWHAGGNETDLLKFGELKHFLGKPKMSKVNRIERPTQNADCFFAH